MHTETLCALRTESDRPQALFRTTHEGARDGPFSEFTLGQDHVCLNVDTAKHSPPGDSTCKSAGLRIPASARSGAGLRPRA